jgi:hypothetical protein
MDIEATYTFYKTIAKRDEGIPGHINTRKLTNSSDTIAHTETSRSVTLTQSQFDELVHSRNHRDQSTLPRSIYASPEQEMCRNLHAGYHAPEVTADNSST